MSDTTTLPPPIEAPPPAARPPTVDNVDPVRELTRLAEQLARAHNRHLLYQYLKARRTLR